MNASGSTISYLTAQALEACLSEQTENGLDPETGELSEWHIQESDHVSGLILASPTLYSHAAVEALLLSRGYETNNANSFMSSVIVVMSNAFRAGWHSRGAVYDAPYFNSVYQKENGTADLVEEWRRSAFEL